MDIEEARKLAEDPVKIRLELLRDLLKITKKKLAENKILLNKARQELSKYQPE